VLRALSWSAVVTSTAAAIWIVATMHESSTSVSAIYLGWLTAVWILLAVLYASPAIFTASQIALVLAVLFGVAAAVDSLEWYTVARYPWLDPWFLELAGIALAAYCLLFGVGRWVVARSGARREESVIESTTPAWINAARRLLETSWPSVDRIVEAALVVLGVALATYAVLPGVAQELSLMEVAGERVAPQLTRFEIPGIAHARAAGPWAWLLLGAVAATLAFGFWQRGDRWRVLGLVVVAMAMCPLLAVLWESDVAVASALRWTTACFFAVASIVMWVIRAASSNGTQYVGRTCSPGVCGDGRARCAGGVVAAGYHDWRSRSLALGLGVGIDGRCRGVVSSICAGKSKPSQNGSAI
jgi:hypothetical protein